MGINEPEHHLNAKNQVSNIYLFTYLFTCLLVHQQPFLVHMDRIQNAQALIRLPNARV